MEQGSRTATLATTTPTPLPHSGTLRWQAGARDGQVGVGWGATQASGSGDLLGQTVGVAHPLGAGRRAPSVWG